MTSPPPRFGALLLRLIAAQACYYLIVSIDLTLTGLVGLALAPTPALITLPLTLIIVVGTACSFLAGHAAARVGYRPVLMVGAGTAIVGGVLSALAVASESFALFCLGTALTGGYRAVGGFLRFLASEYAGPATRERALAWVMYGGVVAAALGPFAAVAASTASATPFVGSCLLITCLGLIAVVLAASLPDPERAGVLPQRAAVRVRERRRDPRFRRAVLVLAGSGLVMTLIMAAGPLASHNAGHGPATGAGMIQWHLIGMFAPSALSALLLRRFGTTAMCLSGGALLALGCALGVLSHTGLAMTLTLAIIGVGWNVLFVAGSAQLLQCYEQGRGAALQGFADGMTAAVSALGSLLAAWTLQGLGWQGVNVVALALVGGIMLAVVGSVVRERALGPAPRPAAAPASAAAHEGAGR